MALKPGLPKGTRDILPQAMQERAFITAIIREVFAKYGYVPIETPAMEKLETLTGKYGEEGDKLIFRILNSGDYLRKANGPALEARDSQALAPSLAEKALRYDLTVPFARFVVQHQNEINFPFRRYQIQPVWRADRPQKGRFREFYQCDADVVGSDSLLLELELIRIYDEVFHRLGLPVTIHLNNRKLLAGLAEAFDIENNLAEFTLVLDKLDKIGLAGVKEEWQKRGFPAERMAGKMEQLLAQASEPETALSTVERDLAQYETGRKGLQEVRFLLQNLSAVNLRNPLQLNLSLARGLDYYTGAILEVTAHNVEMGSLGGGGRYDDLTGIFGLKGLSGVGISFGLDRIQMVMEELKLFPEASREGTEVLFVNFGEREALHSLGLANALRDMDRRVEVYPDPVKLKKQMDYANKEGIPKVVIIGSAEIDAGRYTLKDMASGEQMEYSRIELLEHFSKNTNPYGRH